MEDKKQAVKSLEELLKVANAYSGWFANLADELSKVLDDIQTSKKEEDTWEMKYPFEKGDEFWFIDNYGNVHNNNWDKNEWTDTNFNQGHIFRTKQQALLEAKRRNLLTRFNAFRDECNGDWKVDWSDNKEIKAYIQYHEQFNKFVIKYTLNRNILQTFGFFKCKQDAERAIELFGDEIKGLYVDCDCEEKEW